MQSHKFRNALSRLERFALTAPTAIICAEALPWKCHRFQVSQALEERGWKVVHILEIGKTWFPMTSQKPLFPI